MALSQEIEGMALIYFGEDESDCLANPGEPFEDGKGAVFDIIRDNDGWLRAKNVRIQDPVQPPFAMTAPVDARLVARDDDAKVGRVSLPGDKRAVFHYSYLPSIDFIPAFDDRMECRIAEVGGVLHAYDISPELPASPLPDEDELNRMWDEAVAQSVEYWAEKPKELDAGPFHMTPDGLLFNPRTKRVVKIRKDFFFILLEMTRKRRDAGGLLVTTLSDREMLRFFEKGKIEALELNLSPKAKRERLETRLAMMNLDVKEVARKKANACRELFAKWAKSEDVRIDYRALIKAVGKGGGYMLADGWAHPPLLERSEARKVYMGRDIEKFPNPEPEEPPKKDKQDQDAEEDQNEDNESLNKDDDPTDITGDE